VTVETTAGRHWEGFIDAKSTEAQLVLRFEKGSAVLWRPIPWQEARSALVDGRSVPVNELRADYRTMATPAKSKAERSRLHSSPELLPHAPADVQHQSPAPQRVIRIACDALLANWDNDVETDGLVVHLQPVDSNEELALASGTLEVELFTLQARAFHHAPQSRGRSVEPILRWVQSVQRSDYSHRGAVIRLPFQAAHPEFDDSLGAYGLVHIKFSVPGSGVFEQSIDGVRIRPWAPLRDYLQMDTGRRFLPHERTGRGKTSWFTDDQ
jgi:hypothetical protein